MLGVLFLYRSQQVVLEEKKNDNSNYITFLGATSYFHHQPEGTQHVRTNISVCDFVKNIFNLEHYKYYMLFCEPTNVYYTHTHTQDMYKLKWI